MDCISINDNKTVIKAVIRGDQKDYDVLVKFAYGEMQEYQCSCKAHLMWRGICKHTVCALLSQYDEILDASKKEEEGKAALNIIEGFKKNIRQDEGTAENDRKVKLLPCFYVDENYMQYISFSIGYSKMYIVKNLCELIANINSEANIAYGKELQFIHKIGAFDKRSIKLIHFIRKSIDYGLQTKTKGDTEPTRFLFLNRYRMDDFFSICVDTEVEADIYNFGYMKGYVTKSIPAVQFEVQIDMDKQFARLNYDALQFFIAKGEVYD